jgi:hypothetical protein
VIGLLCFLGMVAFGVAAGAYERRLKRPRWSRFPAFPRPVETSPIARLLETATATCRGTVVSSDRTFTSSSGRSVIWYECVIRRRFPDLDQEDPVEVPPILREASAFELEDASGKRVRVLPVGGYLLPDASAMEPTLTNEALRARLQSLLTFRGKALHSSAELLMAETYLALNEEAVVQGTFRRSGAGSYCENARLSVVSASEGAELLVWPPDR